jgi:serine/threonine protein kinase
LKDLKLENVLLSSKDILTSTVKLADFGLARQLRSGTREETELYSPCGTPTYLGNYSLFLSLIYIYIHLSLSPPRLIFSAPSLAPEVAKSEGYSISADLWSLGVLMYMSIFGFAPFASDDVDELLEQIVVGQVYFPDGACSDEGLFFFLFFFFSCTCSSLLLCSSYSQLISFNNRQQLLIC